MTRKDEPVEISGYTVPSGSCVIHFYYSQHEQQRLLGFLRDGLVRHEGGVLACTEGTYGRLRDGLKMLDAHSKDLEFLQVAITADLPTTIVNIESAVRYALAHEHTHRARLLCDFGSMVGQESIFELEGALSSALRGLNLVSVTQYDGRVFAAPVTIEQFQTHALAIVGNAFFRENWNYTPPDAYYRKRAAGSRG